MAEFQRRAKQRTEDWAPTLQSEAQLSSWMKSDTGVRQRAPANFDTAVAAALELETYLLKGPTRDPTGRQPSTNYKERTKWTRTGRSKRCFNCGEEGHFAK